MYFLVIFMANLFNTLIYFVSTFSNTEAFILDWIPLQLGPSDLKAIGASFSQLITATMISRLVLNLRSLSYVSDSQQEAAVPLQFSDPNRDISVFVARTIGNLGGEMDTFLDYDHDTSRLVGREEKENIPLQNRGA